MPQMKISKVTRNIRGYTYITTFLLLDEQQQRIMVLQLQDHKRPGPMYATSQQDKATVEPLTIDFLVNVLHALGGTIEEITLDSLPGDVLYARVHLRDQDGLQIIKTPLDDALWLAHREHSKISVPPETLDQQ
ncbi:MAG TPA: bifunctional nuclease domain-containing protein, partial [Ktedonobacteraceae bacterium]|nr:bifunctional nuclease domain-containing protein [Ktedonobacteraceae bacterium]